MTSTKKGFLNIITGALSQLIIICLGIVIPRLVLVSYGSTVNGLLTSINQIFACFSLFEAGIGVAALQSLYAPVATQNRSEIASIMAATHRFYKMAGTLYIAAVILLSFVYPVAVHTDLDFFFVVGIILFSGLGNGINFIIQAKYRILLQAEGRSYVIANINTFIQIATNLIKTVLLLAGFDVLVVQFSFFLLCILQSVVYLIYIRKKYSWLDLRHTKAEHTIGQKSATLIHQISSLVFNNTDVLLLTFMADLKVVSVYTIYNMIITMVNTLVQQVASGFDFRLGQLYNSDRDSYFQLHHLFETFYLILIFVSMTMVYVLILPFMRLYTAGVDDTNYLEPMYALIFVLVPLLTYGRTAASNLINYAGHFKNTQWRAVTEMCINLSVTVLGIWKFGIYGALLGTIVASLYRTNDMILYVYRHLLPGSPWQTYKRWLASILIFTGVVFFVPNDLAILNSYPRIILAGIVTGLCSLIIYSGAQMIINPRERRLFFTITKDVLGKLKKAV